MANYTYPQSIVEGLTGTTLLTRLEANLGQPTTPTAGSLQAWLNADGVGSRNLARTNFAWYAGFQGGQFAAGTLTSPTVADATTHRAVDTRCLGTLSITAGALNTNSVGQRVLALGRKGGDVKAMQVNVTKIGMLRGHGLVTIPASASSATASIDWTTGTTPTVKEQMPAGWTTPLTYKMVTTTKTKLGAGEDYWEDPSMYITSEITTVTDSGFILRACRFVSSTSYALSVTATTLTCGFDWRATVEHA